MAPKLNSPKRLKEEVENDRISTLPDSVLCHILSFLPTRTSVATMSLLSRRWRHLWKHLQVFDFDDDYNGNGNRELRKMFKSFAFFVNAVLSLRKSRDIRKFRLSCVISDVYKFPGDCVDMWIRAAIGPHLEELSLTISNGFGAQLVSLPHSFLNCTNLVSLSLVGSIHVKIQHSSVHFPSLKMLKIDPSIVERDIDIVELEFDIVDPLIEFLSGCPILETFDTYFDCGFLTNVPVPPSTKRLKLTGGNFSWTCFEIDSDWLNVKYGKNTLGIIGNLQTVGEAYLDIFSLRESEFVDPMLNHLQNQKHDLHLLLRHSTSKWPLHTPVLNYPEFCNLHHLKFILPCFNTNLLLNVLEKCHMLQVLILQSTKEEPSPFRTWEPKSTKVPKCLESHLTYIHIEGYQGFEDELAIAEYILRNGLVLHTMLIIFHTSTDQTNKHCSLKRLTDIPRGSVACQLKFDSIVSP
ncbi:F-box/FBD/LRR-repeat protein [Trifolium medium]|uniref:F-box/FBD/LRR-repeat protein n=1 Tax=Trifolium medium TaxID=97028 RepID=A0A392M1I8_9FABA|nr:F-box/FBD/LRR-repeat protein [Trifolium medium]